MITVSEIKLIKSLQEKKYRNEYGLFVTEGKKSVSELLSSAYETENVYVSNEDAFAMFSGAPGLRQVSQVEMKRMSGLDNPADVMAVAKIPAKNPEIDFKGIVIALDNIRDPGNLGSIIRTAEWFGVKTVLCSVNTVDAYNPKVVQATMGSLFRLNIGYVSLKETLNKATAEGVGVYATAMEGEDAFQFTPAQNCVLIFGNEGKGIDRELLDTCTSKISIPGFSHGETKPESLNVAASAAIMMALIKKSAVKF